MIVETWPQVSAIFLYDVRRQFVTFFISVSCFMLFEPFLWCFAGHTYIQALEHAMELWFGLTELGAFGEYLP